MDKNSTNEFEYKDIHEKLNNKSKPNGKKILLVIVILAGVALLVAAHMRYKPNYDEFFSTAWVPGVVIAMLIFLLWKVKHVRSRIVFVIAAALIVGAWWVYKSNSSPLFNGKSGKDKLVNIKDSTDLMHKKAKKLKAKNIADSIALSYAKREQAAINAATGALCTEKDFWNSEAIKARQIAEEYKKLKASANQKNCNVEVVDIDEDTRVVYVQ